MLALNLESVKPVNYTTVNGERLPLFKSRYTSNLSPVHVSDYMSGKMTGIPSISTSCLENPICRARMENGESVCAHCFAAATLDRYTAAGVHAANNLRILTWQVLPLDLLPRFRNVAIVRVESFGDVANVTQARNYLNICRVNPFITFAAWTKNASIWNEAIELDGKPENLSLVYSSFKLNIPANPEEYFTAAGENHFDHIFTVFDKKTADFYGDGFINCGARDCATCRRCYGKNPQEFNVKELLK